MRLPSYWLGIKYRRLLPTRSHFPVLWENFSKDVFAINEAGEVRRFDHRYEEARAFAGIDNAADNRLVNFTEEHQQLIPSQNGNPAPSLGQSVLWIVRESQELRPKRPRIFKPRKVKETQPLPEVPASKARKEKDAKWCPNSGRHVAKYRQKSDPFMGRRHRSRNIATCTVCNRDISVNPTGVFRKHFGSPKP